MFETQGQILPSAGGKGMKKYQKAGAGLCAVSKDRSLVYAAADFQGAGQCGARIDQRIAAQISD
jgi:hypothetical protein